jgi:hypothetical protein
MVKWLLLICIVVITVSLLLQRKVEQVTGALRNEVQTSAMQPEAAVQFPAVIDRTEPLVEGGQGQKHLTHAEEQLTGRVAPVHEKSGPGQILAQ